MNTLTPDSELVVCSRSFSKNKILINQLKSIFKNVKFNDEGLNLSGEGLVRFIGSAEAAIVGLEKIDSAILSNTPHLKVIAKYGVGLDGINISDLEAYGIKLAWQGGVNKRAVSELALSFMLMAIRRIPEAMLTVQNGGWQQIVGQNLTQKTIGIIGVGHVGLDLISILRPFSCKILVNDIRNLEAVKNDFEVSVASKDEIYSNADIVSLHVPLTDLTRGMICMPELEKFKPGAILINTSRGGIVDEDALYRALKIKKLGAACFDVMKIEPPNGSQLLELENFFITPHIGGSSSEAILAMGMSSINGLKALV